MFKKISLAAVVALSAALPMAAQAESDVNTGTGSLGVSARVNFNIVVPKVLFLQVGTGTLLADNTTVDTLTFTVPTGGVGGGTAVAATGGNSGPSGLVFRLISTGGAVTLGATGAVPTSGTNTIPWSQISVTPSGAAPTAPIPGGATVAVPAPSGFVDATGAWTYSYLNTGGVIAGGTYATTVTYTASVP